jgi:WXG100 family type VII secretion target
MSGSGDNLVYNFAGIDTMSATIAAFVSNMNADLAEVDAKFQHLLAEGWHGKAAESFYACSRKWHAGAEQMAQTLQKLSSAVGTAGANMAQADAQAAARF